MSLLSYLLGWGSALLVGFSKTGLPGVSIPGILLMTEAFADDAKLSLGAILPVLLVGDVFAVAWYRHHAQWDRLLGLFPYVLLGMVPGVGVLCLVDGNQLRPLLGSLVLGLLSIEVYRRWRGRERGATAGAPPTSDGQRCICSPGASGYCCTWPSDQPNVVKLTMANVGADAPRRGRWWFMATMGALAGFATIIANAAMPVMTIYFLSRGMLKKEFIGTAAWFFFLVNLSKLPICYYVLKVITPRTMQFGLIVAPVTVIGALLGVYVLARIPQRFFDALALSLAGIAAVRLIVV